MSRNKRCEDNGDVDERRAEDALLIGNAKLSRPKNFLHFFFPCHSLEVVQLDILRPESRQAHHKLFLLSSDISRPSTMTVISGPS